MTAKILYGSQVSYIRIKMRWRIFLLALISYKNPITALKGLGYLLKMRKNVKGNQVIKKLVLHNGAYYFGAYVPPWNSPHFRDFVINNLNNFKPSRLKTNRFNNIFFAITKKCTLQCAHCFEWDELNKKETLDIEKINEILIDLEQYGYNQLIISGGEPMIKLDWVLKILSQVALKVNCWVFTSGYNLSLENANKLKYEGLKGVYISLDHYNKKLHNTFRGNEKSFDWVLSAIQNANKADLLVCLSLCVTKEMATKEHLENYMSLAKELGVSFVQLLEPKPVGHFKGKDVLLNTDQIALLEGFYQLYNTHKSFKEYPIIMYHGYHQRRIGCFNAGHIGLYINTDGVINACPFCHLTENNKDITFEEKLNSVIETGCVEYGVMEM